MTDWKNASPAQSESDRVAALHRYDLLDTAAEARFDRFTRLAAASFNVPIALITLLDTERQGITSCVGMDRRETEREIAFCRYTIQQEEVFVVPNAADDPRFADNPLVTDSPGIRFYAGAPLVTPDGRAVGALCVMDTAPRTVTAQERLRLRDLAVMAMEGIVLRHEAAAHTCSERLQRTQNTVLEQVARGAPLREILEAIASFVEAQRDDLQVSILIYDSEGGVLRRGAAPSLPPAYVASIDGVEVGPDVGSCGAAVYRNEPVVAEDLRTDPRWASYRALTEQYGLRACWSIPIRGEEGTVLGVLGVYYPAPKAPSEAEWLLSETAAHLAGIALEQQRRKEALHASTQKANRLAEAVHRANDGVVITDADGAVEWVNAGFTRMCGHTLQDLKGRRPGEVLQGPETDPEAVAYMREQINHSEGFETEVVNYHKSGRPYWVRIETEPLIDEQGTLTGFMAIETDVTERKEAEAALRQREKQLQQAQEEAEAMSRLKSAFLANMSHEIRTPLTSIIGFAELIGDEPDAVPRFAELIRRGGKRLLRTLNALLDLAQLESGTMQLECRAVDVGAEVEMMVDALRAQACEKGLALELDVPDDAVWAFASAGVLHRIVDHLVGNAIKFTQEGEVQVAVSASDGTVQLRVSDTGMGITEPFQAEMFEAFTQESTGTTRDFEGSGLGLNIVKQLVEALDGTIAVESVRGEGTAVTVTLPAADPPEA